MSRTGVAGSHYLFASDFDQTLSFNDSGAILSDLIGVSGFQDRVAGLASTNLVHQGAELAYLLRHDPAFRTVRSEHLVETGRRLRLKADIGKLTQFLDGGIDGARFSFYVISAAPQEVIQAALEDVVAPEFIFGTQLDYDAGTGEIRSISRVPAGFGKVAVVEEIAARHHIALDRVIYVGDGNSDVHVMLHVNNCDGFTISVSDNRRLGRIARRTILSDSAFSVVLPALEDVFGWQSGAIRALFKSYGLPLHDWERIRTDLLTIGDGSLSAA